MTAVPFPRFLTLPFLTLGHKLTRLKSGSRNPYAWSLMSLRASMTFCMVMRYLCSAEIPHLNGDIFKQVLSCIAVTSTNFLTAICSFVDTATLGWFIRQGNKHIWPIIFHTWKPHAAVRLPKHLQLVSGATRASHPEALFLTLMLTWRPDPTLGSVLELGLLGSVISAEIPRSNDEQQRITSPRAGDSVVCYFSVNVIFTS
jgi:hypothetical protein